MLSDPIWKRVSGLVVFMSMKQCVHDIAKVAADLMVRGASRVEYKRLRVEYEPRKARVLVRV